MSHDEIDIATTDALNAAEQALAGIEAVETPADWRRLSEALAAAAALAAVQGSICEP